MSEQPAEGHDVCGQPVTPDPETYAWLVERAALFYDGSVARCVEAVLREAFERHRYYATRGAHPLAQEPEDPWAALQARVPPPGVRARPAGADGVGNAADAAG